jgi:uncharacterized membrane protein YbhN (UPF0104 family)
MPDSLRAGSTAPPTARPTARRLRSSWRALATAALGVVSVGLLLWVAPPSAVIGEISHMSPVWIGVAVALELASCLGYVIIFRLFFREPPRGVSRRVAWISMGVGAVLPGGNISSAAATGLLLRKHGIGTRELIGRCAALLCLLTGFGFFATGVSGLLVLVGLGGRSYNLLHAFGPMLVGFGVLAVAALVVLVSRRAGERAPRPVRALAGGLEGGWRAAIRPNWRLLGGAGYLLLDMGALWAACAATGHSLGFPALIIAYCIGYLATAIPMPAGLGVLDSGLAASLVLYGLSPTAAVGAVLVYHAIAIWVPAVGGLVAWLPVRRTPPEVSPSRPVPRFGPVPAPRLADS